MTEHEDHISTEATEAGYETRDIALGKTIAWAVAIIVAIVVSIVGLWEYFITVREELYYESVLKPESSRLREVRAHETELLSSYGVVDSTKGVYRVPIDRAMQLMVDESYAKGKQ